MDKSFFKDLLGVEVNITYKDGKKVSYTDGTIEKVEKDFLVVSNVDCAVAIDYGAVITCRTKNHKRKE